MNRPVVLASDERYAMPMTTLLRSIVDSNRSGWPLEFHILFDGVSESTKQRVADSLPGGAASIRWVPIKSLLFREFWTASHVSKMTFARLLIPRVFPDTVSRVLYLDIDTLVLDDLTSIWETDLDGALIGAVLDNLDAHLKSGKPYYEEAPRVKNYFNAGVLLIDLTRWRKEQVTEKALDYMNQHPNTPFMDQDALNVVCDGRWKMLDQRWNFHDCWSRDISRFNPSDRPGIVHFVSTMKPWKAELLSVNASFYDTFRCRTQFARTPWDKVRDCIKRVNARLRAK
jgi:lipopolysaccharide biosynthesis glycosyltransferase